MLHYWWANVIVIVCTAAVIAAFVARWRGWWRPSPTRAVAALPYLLATFTLFACLLAVLGNTLGAIIYGVPTLIAWAVWSRPQWRTLKLYRSWIYVIVIALLVNSVVQFLQHR